MSEIIRVGIIGTAGRKEDQNRLNGEKWRQMKEKVEEIIIALFGDIKKTSIQFVSGGAAYADFIAVVLAEKYEKPLILHLPCSFNKKFIGGKTGETVNWYHYLFSKKITKFEGKSLMLMDKVIKRGAKVTVSNGFFARNSLVAQDSDYLIALTFGNGPKLKDGGTADTMKKFIKLKGNENSFHINLGDMKIYNPAEI
jgi:hypothetical protein